MTVICLNAARPPEKKFWVIYPSYRVLEIEAAADEPTFLLSTGLFFFFFKLIPRSGNHPYASARLKVCLISKVWPVALEHHYIVVSRLFFRYCLHTPPHTLVLIKTPHSAAHVHRVRLWWIRNDGINRTRKGGIFRVRAQSVRIIIYYLYGRIIHYFGYRFLSPAILTFIQYLDSR